ncbi:peptide-methionine (R)-S-oxide reductase [Sphingobium fontiphilum]|uniref:peptide-methionine (R)-S-oxide reductase n=1 Tax=Sphingobium fontiphilum TaxID=944425 RepID=A0A7W6DP08_9SPHN|nr:peptide-methionine (R)-S-oxide reductase MsrB [Sphingobium fontiphilum]MBB3983413.1 peptide-methionine (R)-S-oxide reductase [Sphingobium fontiphilum]
MDRRHFLVGGAAAAIAAATWWQLAGDPAQAAYPFTLTDAQWRQRLSPLAYNVLRRKATEHPFTSPLNKEHRAGTFVCAGCDLPLFSSKTKFDSGTGWPSFWRPLPRAVGTSRDFDLGYARTEVHCARCGGHLGHVFDDGPKPTGLRYCMNGVALSFRPG